MRALVEPKKLPVKLRSMLKTQCDGEWDRVTVDDDGAFTVHNNALQAQRFIGAAGGSSNGRTRGSSPPNAGSTPVPPSRRKPPPAEPLTTLEPPPRHRRSRLRLTAEASVLAGVLVPGVEFIPAPAPPAPPEPPEPEPEPELLVSEGIGEAPDWATVNVDVAAYKLLERCRKGLPLSVSYQLRPEVMALYGVDWDLVEACVRNPERVEVRPETRNKDKGYPILGFYRGDLMTVLGMRLPQRPAVIAVYTGSRLDTDDTRGPRGTGGGGSRKTQGLPRTSRQVVNQLRAAGAKIDDESVIFGEKQAEVTFSGQCLGKITVDPNAPRATCESDYQRMLRKINAIKERQPV